MGGLLAKLSKLGGKPAEAVGGVVKNAFEGLASANRDLMSGGLQLPRLQIEQGRDLLQIVCEVTGRPLVLIFDQWEKSPGIATEANILDSFLRHLDDWPPCHTFLGLRAEGEALKAVKGLHQDFKATAKIYELPAMHLADSSDSKSRLLDFLHGEVAATATIPDDEVLQMLSGYPGTLARWTSSYNAQRLQSDELKDVADDANAYRFAEFDELLPSLTEGQRLLSIRLALLPATSDAETWKALRPILLEQVPPKELDELRRKNVLESSPPPTYGHAKRQEAALRWRACNCYEETREVCERLILDLAGQVREVSAPVVPYVSSLVELRSLGAQLELSGMAQALCEAAVSLYPSLQAQEQKLLGVVAINGVPRATAPLLAIGLFNTLNAAKREEALERRDGLLDELRQLAVQYPDDAAVREPLAKGLFNTLIDAKKEEARERRDTLLEDLRQLARAYPDDAAVREWLVKGLFNTLIDAKQKEALERRDALLEELRQLAGAYPDDEAVREIARVSMMAD